MRKVILVISLISMFPFALQAQEELPTFEVFGGYSYLRLGSGYDQNMDGWNTAVATNLTRHFAVKGDFAGHYDRFRVTNGVVAANISTSQHTFLFGPQFNLRVSDRVNPFIHAVFGAGRPIFKIQQGVNRQVIADVGFAMAVGGGLDTKWNERVSWRVFQTDYLLLRFRDPSVTPVQKRNVNQFRFSTGLVIH